MGIAEALGDVTEDVGRDALGIGGDLPVPVPNDFPPKGFKCQGPLGVVIGLFEVLPTVEFHRQPCRATSQIDKLAADDQLASKAWAGLRQ